MKTALVTGISGQDGSFLAEFLLDKGYEVHGVIRRSSVFSPSRINHIRDKLNLHYGDMLDGVSLRHILEKSAPDEVYNLAAQSHVKVSFEVPEYTADSVGTGTLRLLEAIRDVAPRAKVYQAGSSEMFGLSAPPQNEKTIFHPRSPYGVSKLSAYWFAVNHRESYNTFVCNGIMFNHESWRRDESFVTRKVTLGVARIKAGKQKTLYLGNLDAERDWGFAGDYVRAMWLMLQQDKPDDYVIATGKKHSVREWVEHSFSAAGLDWKEHVAIDKKLYRPAEVHSLCGDARKAKKELGWHPTVQFDDLVKMMVKHDMESEIS